MDKTSHALQLKEYLRNKLINVTDFQLNELLKLENDLLEKRRALEQNMNLSEEEFRAQMKENLNIYIRATIEVLGEEDGAKLYAK